jgi:hypothetical protein
LGVFSTVCLFCKLNSRKCVSYCLYVSRTY